ncbi:MAG: hypothetical protein ACREQ5_07365 [Candidatus Dormibacteria bacterium]
MFKKQQVKYIRVILVQRSANMSKKAVEEAFPGFVILYTDKELGHGFIDVSYWEVTREARSDNYGFLRHIQRPSH